MLIECTVLAKPVTDIWMKFMSLLRDVNEGGAVLFQVSSTAKLEGKGQLKFSSGKWSPHHNCSQLATANDTAIRGWDLRTMR